MPHRREDYLERGHSPADLAAALRTGELVRLGRGLYGEAGSWQTPEDRHRDLLAAMLPDLMPGSVLSHASAGVLHGLWVEVREWAALRGVRQGRDHTLIPTTQASASAAPRTGE